MCLKLIELARRRFHELSIGFVVVYETRMTVKIVLNHVFLPFSATEKFDGCHLKFFVVTQGGQQHGRKISPVSKLHAVEHIVSPKYESLPSDPVIDHLASFDSFSDLDPESRKQSSAEGYRNQVLLPELLVTRACPVIADCQQQQQHESYSNFASALHVFRLIVPQQQGTAVKDVACQCDGQNGSDNSGNNNTFGCSLDDGLFPAKPPLSLPVKMGDALRKRYVGKRHFQNS
ncbi:unnamed protein product [Brugia timori]|uniref:Uncharacterized protein n=1 Tax=Brugia timori TaxID=42155 RepID=A0A0R3Q3N0_9BILA|nr:unnamed protein product [Brugia timori]